MSKVIVKLNFGKALKTERAAVSALVRKVTFDAEGDMKLLAPIDTGFLRSTINGEIENEFTGIVSVGAEYAPFVNYGTANQTAQPFFEPAMDMAQRNLERAAQGMLK